MMMMLFLAVFIINPVHINSHHVSSRIVEWRFCCRNIFVQLWRVNFDDVKTEKNVCHSTDWCHVHNRSFANPLILNKLDESGRLLGSSAWEGLIEWRMMSRAHTLVSYCSWSDDDRWWWWRARRAANEKHHSEAMNTHLYSSCCTREGVSHRVRLSYCTVCTL